MYEDAASFRRNTWTEDDEIYLEYYVSDHEIRDYAEASEFLGKSRQGVRIKASRLRKRNKQVGYIRKPFQQWEINYLKRNYLFISRQAIADHLNRTVHSISNKAEQLGLKRVDDLSAYDKKIRDLAKQGVYRAEIARRLGINRTSLSYYLKRNNIPCKYADKEAHKRAFNRDIFSQCLEVGANKANA